MICEMTVKKFCCEDISKIENYDKAVADNSRVWHCHHRLETHNSDNELRLVDLSQKELKALEMYYDRPADELIFMSPTDHLKLHNKGKKLSDKTRKKIATARKGIQLSEETRKKIAAVQKGRKHSEETRRKMSETWKGRTSNTKGKHWKLVDGKRVYY